MALLRESGLQDAKRTTVNIDGDTAVALWWLRDRRVTSASALLRKAASLALQEQGYAVVLGEVEYVGGEHPSSLSDDELLEREKAAFELYMELSRARLARYPR